MTKHTVVETHAFNTVGDLLALLTKIKADHRMYLVDAAGDYPSILEVVESKLSDGSVVQDIRIRCLGVK